MKRECRHCHEDLSHVPPTAAMTRHITGLCAPSRNEVEAAIEEFEQRNVREEEMIRRQMTQERSKPIEFTNRTMWVLAGGAIIGALLLYGFMFVRAIPALKLR